jgi:hypothetical protein
MNNLIGRYKLVTHGTYKKAKFVPTSLFLKGELSYSIEGHLSVLIFFNEDQESPRMFLAYSGTYEITSSHEVVHKIHICSNSKKDKSIEMRNYKKVDEFLFLTIQLEEDEKFEAKWERLI